MAIGSRRLLARPLRRQTAVAALLLIPGTLIVALVVRSQTPLTATPSALVGLLMTGIGYAAYVYRRRELGFGALALIATTSTMVAEVPVADSFTYYPGQVVGDVLLVHGALAHGVVYWVWVMDLDLQLDVVAAFLLAFAAWTVLSAIAAGSPFWLAAWYVQWILLGLAGYVLFRSVVIARWATLEDLIVAYLCVLGAHALVAVAQLLAGGNFGLTVLGEGADIQVSALDVLGVTLSPGTYVSGFTGMSFELANLVVLLLPAAIVLLIVDHRLDRLAVGGGLVALAALLLRASSSDAARGGAIVAVGVLVGGLLLVRREHLDRLAAAVPGLLLTLLPSSVSGQPARVGIPTRSGSAERADPQATSATAERLRTVAHDLQIPLFDLSNLGPRIDQYAAAMAATIDNPVFGLGPGSFVRRGTEYGLVAARGPLTDPVHNVYLMLLAETGIVGGVLYAGAIGYALVRMSRGWWIEREPLLLALAAGVAGTLAFAMFDLLQFYAVSAYLPLWILLGGAVARCAGTRDRPTVPLQSPEWSR